MNYIGFIVIAEKSASSQQPQVGAASSKSLILKGKTTNLRTCGKSPHFSTIPPIQRGRAPTYTFLFLIYSQVRNSNTKKSMKSSTYKLAARTCGTILPKSPQLCQFSTHFGGNTSVPSHLTHHSTLNFLAAITFKISPTTTIKNCTLIYTRQQT